MRAFLPLVELCDETGPDSHLGLRSETLGVLMQGTIQVPSITAVSWASDPGPTGGELTHLWPQCTCWHSAVSCVSFPWSPVDQTRGECDST